MKDNSPCIIQRPDDRYVCSYRGILFSPNAKPPIHCICDVSGPPANSEKAITAINEFDGAMRELGVEIKDAKQRSSLWLRWREAIVRWKKAGKPVRNSNEMEACLRICKGSELEGIKTCEHYAKRAGVLGYCEVCGCHVNNTPIGELNKIRMKTEKCPKGKWE